MTPDEIRKVAKFRKRGRLPAMSWCGPEICRGSIWRCAQPLEGILSGRAPEDEKFLELLTEGRSQKVLVMDLRPVHTAYVNKFMGGGFESSSHYKDAGCTLEFGSIHNIHKVRDAWKAMRPSESVMTWWQAAGNSYWYEYVSTILKVTARCCSHLQHEGNVVIHCSDGWDRTAQVSSLVGLCLDPFYRTQRGFAVLVEKEFSHFGHQFHLRAGHGHKSSSESSPIFVQWLDCVHQVMYQHPNAFEFSATFLLRLADELYSCKYSSFLTDCERDRRAIEPNTVAVWTDLFAERHINPGYRPEAKHLGLRWHGPAIRPWQEYFLRYSGLRAGSVAEHLASLDAEIEQLELEIERRKTAP
jgi:hypothetical protein